MTRLLMPSPRQRFENNAGVPAAGCLLYTYEAGTTTPKATYTSAVGTTEHPNPIPLDAKGEAAVWFDGAYRVDLKTAAGVQITGYPIDDFTTPDLAAMPNALRAELVASDGAKLIGSAAWYGTSIIGFDASAVPDGATVVFSGRTAAQDGGGGTFTYYKTGTQTIDQGLVFEPTGGGRLVRNGCTVFGFRGPASVAYWGAKNDGTDSGGLALAVAAANAFPMDLLLLPGINATSTQLKITCGYKLLGGKVSTLKAISVGLIPSIVAVGPDLLGAQDNSASNYQLGGMEGITFDGNGKVTNCVVFAGGTYNVTGYSTKECKFINANSDGVATLNNFFICQFYSCAFNNNSGHGFNLGSGNNAGENVSFYSCGFFNNGLSGLFCENSGPGGASVFAYGCSFDYNQNWGLQNGTTTANATVVALYGGHIENFKQYAINYGTLNFTDVVMFGGGLSGTLGYLIDNQGGMTIRGGWVQNAGTGVLFNPASVVYSAASVINIPESFPMVTAPGGGPIVAATVYQNKTGAYLEVSVPFTFGSGAGQVQGWIGATSTPAFLVANRTGNSNPTAEYLTIRVPPFHYYKIETVGTGTISAGHVHSFG